MTNDTFDADLEALLVGVLNLVVVTGLGAVVEWEDDFRAWVRRWFFSAARDLGDVVFVGDNEGERD